MATYLPSLKLSKEEKRYIPDTAGEARTNSQVTFAYGLWLTKRDLPTTALSGQGCSLEDLPGAMDNSDGI